MFGKRTSVNCIKTKWQAVALEFNCEWHECHRNWQQKYVISLASSSGARPPKFKQPNKTNGTAVRLLSLRYASVPVNYLTHLFRIVICESVQHYPVVFRCQLRHRYAEIAEVAKQETKSWVKINTMNSFLFELTPLQISSRHQHGVGRGCRRCLGVCCEASSCVRWVSSPARLHGGPNANTVLSQSALQQAQDIKTPIKTRCCRF